MAVQSNQVSHLPPSSAIFQQATRSRARGRIALHRLPRSPRRTDPERCLLPQVCSKHRCASVSSKQLGEPSPSSAIFHRAQRVAARICSPALAPRSPARCILRRWRRRRSQKCRMLMRWGMRGRRPRWRGKRLRSSSTPLLPHQPTLLLMLSDVHPVRRNSGPYGMPCCRKASLESSRADVGILGTCCRIFARSLLIEHMPRCTPLERSSARL